MACAKAEVVACPKSTYFIKFAAFKKLMEPPARLAVLLWASCASRQKFFQLMEFFFTDAAEIASDSRLAI
jgi:hypothetical protein